MALVKIASALPSIKQSYKDIALDISTDEEFILRKVGIETRSILAEGETGLSLAKISALKLLDEISMDSNEIDLLVYVTQNPERRIPHNSPLLALELGLSQSAASFDISLGCSGYVYGINIVESFLKFNELKHALLITSDPYSRIMAKEDKSTNAVFGDAATASLISNVDSDGQFSGFNFGTLGAGGDAIRIDKGGASYPIVSLNSEVEMALTDRDSYRLKMDGREVFNFVNSYIPKSIQQCLNDTGNSVDDIDYFAIHQGSLYMLKTLAMRARIPEEKLLINITRYGNTVSSTIPLLIEDLLRDSNISMSGKKLVISGFGVGLSWATAMIEF